MKITTTHSASYLGYPVIVADDGTLMDTGPGIRAIRESLGLTRQQLAPLLGINWRTLEGWEQGNKAPAAKRLYMLAELIQKKD